MIRFLNTKGLKIVIAAITCLITGLFLVITFKNYETIASNNDFTVSEESLLITALSSYFGEWEIVEDLGYHGIHRETEIEVFKVEGTLYFYEDVFSYENSIEIFYPNISIEITTSPEMEKFDKIEYPHHLGFGVNDSFTKYAKVIIKNENRNIEYVLYILNDKEIILEGDIHRYYRAVKVK